MALRPLRVVAVPGGVAARVHERGRPVARHLARRLADDGRLDAGLRVRPLGRVRRELGGEGLEAEPVLRDVLLVVEPLGHQHVHPGEEEREVGAGLDRQVVLRLAGRDREARVDDDEARARVHRLGELLHLRVVHVLAEVRADEHEAARVPDVGALGRADLLAERQVEADVARAAALREGRRRDVRRAVGLERVLEEGAAEAVREQRDRLRAVLRLDRLHLLGDVAERLVPGHLRPHVLAAPLAADERRLQAIVVEVGADAAGAARAEAAPAQRVVRVALDLPELAVLDVGDRPALPEADVAEGRDLLQTPGRDAPSPAARPASLATPAVADVAAMVAAEICRNRRRERESMRPLVRCERGSAEAGGIDAGTAEPRTPLLRIHESLAGDTLPPLTRSIADSCGPRSRLDPERDEAHAPPHRPGPCRSASAPESPRATRKLIAMNGSCSGDPSARAAATAASTCARTVSTGSALIRPPSGSGTSASTRSPLGDHHAAVQRADAPRGGHHRRIVGADDDEVVVVVGDRGRERALRGAPCRGRSPSRPRPTPCGAR